MQIDPAALSRSTDVSTPVQSGKSATNTAPASQKTRADKAPQRIDYEPIYAELKAAIGLHWTEYTEALTRFLRGTLNHNELAEAINDLVCADAKTEHLHNHLISAICCNLSRDIPDTGVASFVSANDKPVAVSKPVSGDAAEQRLKTEVMQLPPRDRRRLKAIPDIDALDARNGLQDYHRAKQIKIPEKGESTASAGGFNRDLTNWGLEISKRYSQPLAAEIGEFPDADSIQARIVPICYEEEIVGGCAPPCADFVSISTETFVKEVLATIYSRTRSNAPSGSMDGIMTNSYRKQLQKEEAAYKRGEIQRNAASGLLPVEAKEAATRRPLGMGDLKLAASVGGGILGHMPLILDRIESGYLEGELEAQKRQFELEREAEATIKEEKGINGDAMDIDEHDWGDEGATPADRQHLDSVLGELLLT